MRIGLKLFVARKDDKLYYLVYTISDKTFRKRILTGIKLEARHWDERNLRIKASHPSSEILNQEMKSIREKLETANAKHETNQFNRHQVIAYLNGESGFGSIDEYIDKDLKNTRKDATYRDLRSAWRSVKQYNDYPADEPLPFNVVNYKFLDTYKRKALLKGNTHATINSNLDKIRVIMNDAFNNGVTYEAFTLNKRLKLPKQKRKIDTCTPEECKKAIDKVKTIYDFQALGFYLLMFCARGMYPADIVSLKQTNLENKDYREDEEFSPEDDPLEYLCDFGHDYLIHRRHKTKNKSNDDMVIRIDEKLYHLINYLKFSVIYTHYPKKPEIVPPLSEAISIFSYDIDTEYELHNNVWDAYKKKVKKLLGHSFNTARKTFDTYSANLDLSRTTRQILLGHIEDSMLWHYGDTNTDEIKTRVQEAHISILKAFDTDNLITLLLRKLDSLNLADWLQYEEGTVWLDQEAHWKHIKKSLKND